MATALEDVMPETHHGLCTWHLFQNGVKHLGSLMNGGSFLLRDIKECMYDIEIEADFEKKWFDWSMIIFMIKLGSFQLMPLR